MNAKTSSILTTINMSTVHINYEDSKNVQQGINGNIKIVFHITNDGLVTVSEYGTLNYYGKEYLVDRTGNMTIDTDVQNGFHKVTKGKFLANPQDNAPSVLVEKLTSSQPVLHYKIQKLDTKTWRISDLQRAIFICRK